MHRRRAGCRRSVASIAPRFYGIAAGAATCRRAAFSPLLYTAEHDDGADLGHRCLAEGIGFWWLLAALGHSLAVVTALFVYAFALLVGGLSFLPGDLGSREAAMIGLLSLYGLPEAAAITATLWFALALGAVFLARQKMMGPES